MAITTRRRRSRRVDPLATPEAIREILEALHLSMPDLIPGDEKLTIRILRAAKHASCSTNSNSKRGRPSRWSRRDLMKITAQVNAILRSRGVSIGMVSFVDYYLRILDFPADVVKALGHGTINLYESQQLARIRKGVNGWSATEARRIRTSLLATHLQAALSGRRLKERVAQTLNVEVHGEKRNEQSISHASDQSRDVDLSDTTHLFWDELRLLDSAFREVAKEDLTEELLDELLRASEKVWGIIAKIKKRSDRKKATGK